MDLRARARELFDRAVAAADPARALLAAFEAAPVPPPAGEWRVLAVGKAAIPMAEALLPRLSGAPVRALIVTNYENARPVAGAEVIAAGHPVPDENGARAALAAAALLDGAGEGDRVVALISGGGSALLPAPAPGLSLADKAEVNRLLLAHGFEIVDINLIRQALSRLKGGGMLRLAAPAPVHAFILSDVIGDDLRAIASGPTVAPLGNRAAARTLLEGRGLWPLLPEAVRTHLGRPEDQTEALLQADNRLIGSNRKSLDAARAVYGAGAMIVSDQLTGDVGAAADQVVAAALRAGPDPACLIFGGETTVTLRGTGLGGRNQELALRVALAMPETGRDWAFLSGGTDGRDGPTDAAGGIVDAGTAARIAAAGADPAALLANNDSRRALSLAGDLLVTGATGTNVADVQVLLLGPAQ